MSRTPSGGLLDADAFGHLAGRVVFFAVPAEEGGDLAGITPVLVAFWFGTVLGCWPGPSATQRPRP